MARDLAKQFSAAHLMVAIDTLNGSLSISDASSYRIFGYTVEARKRVAEILTDILQNIKLDPIPVEELDIIEETVV